MYFQFPLHVIRVIVLKSTCKSSKQTQHVSASLCGYDGWVEDDPADANFEHAW